MPFEGFLEGLVRIAGLKALPNDGEIEAARMPNAAALLEDMRLQTGDAYTSFLQQRAGTWGLERSAAEQPLHRAVDHMLSILLRAILKDDIAGKEEVNLEAMLRWMDRVMPSEQPGGNKKAG